MPLLYKRASNGKGIHCENPIVEHHHNHHQLAFVVCTSVNDKELALGVVGGLV